MWRRRPSDDDGDFTAVAAMLMQLDAKLDAILDALEIDFGEETDLG